MTFKHMKFEDSAVMRSLEKISVEKGLVKEASTKTKSINELVGNKLIASNNLTENIVKLCDHLRKNGFESYASELEYKFLNYKTAATLYETSKETGEDLIDMAHPKGSHKLEGVPGDSTIETVVDRQKAILNTVNKNPTGKLSNAKDIINAVKIVLAEDSVKLSNDQRIFYSKKFLYKTIDLFNNLSEYLKKRGDIPKAGSILNSLKDKFDRAVHISEITLDNDGVIAQINKIDKILWDEANSWFSPLAEAEKKQVIEIKNWLDNILPAAQGKLDNSYEWLKGMFGAAGQISEQKSETNQQDDARAKEFLSQIDQIFEKIESWEPLIKQLDANKKQQANRYYNGLNSLLTQLKSDFNAEKNKSGLAQSYIRVLNKKLRENNFDQFSQWLDKETE